MEPDRILKGSRVAEVDRKCINDGIDSKHLMNNAGSSVAKIIIEDFKGKKFVRDVKGIVVCGSGNNGGDGFVAAADLIKSGMDIKVFYISLPEKFSPDCKYYFKKLVLVGEDKLFYLNLKNKEIEDIFRKELAKSDFIVDAIFGTGLHGKEIHGPSRQIIEDINQAKRKNENLTIYSVDIPSGVDSDSAKILECAVKADVTVTFGCKKLGLANYPGADFAGRVKVADIGIPDKYFKEYEQIFEADLRWVSDRIPDKKPWTYKHEVGKLLVIAGSLGLTGAAVMTCLAAMRAGAGLVTLVCPWELNDIFEEKLTEVMTYPVEQTDEVTIHSDCLDEIIGLSERFDALAIGPGLSRNPKTICLVREILSKIKKPTVLDADGLCALSGPREIGNEKDLDLSHVIITPHAGELSAILGRNSIGLESRLEANVKVAKKYKLTSVLKGAGTLITSSSGKTFINPTGDWALATAGTGDILTGIIGSLLCQGMGFLDSAVCGAFIHGKSSDIMVKNTSRTSLMATDLLEGIKSVFLEIEKIKYHGSYKL